jgi:hypothetical protein
MKDALIGLVKSRPGLKARVIARELGFNKTEVNGFLHKNSDDFFKDLDYGWHFSGRETLIVTLTSEGWVDGESFDKSLCEVGSVFDPDVSDVHFIFPSGCRMLLEAGARMLALVNQLDLDKKRVVIDFGKAENVYGYLDRVGFISHLAPGIKVLPDRPIVSAVDKYRGNSQTVVEFGAINPNGPDNRIPRQLSDRFVELAGGDYKQASFTLFSELFGNVCEHSETPIPGYAALQKYLGKNPKIQIVVSDSGKGIIGTLVPVLEKYYPDLQERFDFADVKAEGYLLKEVLEQGRISQTGREDRGLGLQRSRDLAQMYNANMSVRQDKFELKLVYRDGDLVEYKIIPQLPKIRGTHVCFDFLLAKKTSSH